MQVLLFSSRSSLFASALNLPPRINLTNTPALQSHNLTQNILDCSSRAPLQPTTFPTTHLEPSSLSPSQYNFDGLHSVTPSSLSQGISDHEEKCKFLKNLVQIVDKNGNITRTQKMSVSDVYKLRNGDKVLVPVNELSQPIKAAGGLCTRFLTTLLKQPLLCPPYTVDFRELKKCSGAKLLKEIHVYFSLPYTDSMNKVLYANLDSKYRNAKYALKAKLLKEAKKKLIEARIADAIANGIGEEEIEEVEVQYSDDELLKALDLLDPPDGFLDHQWKKYKCNIRSEKSKKLSQNGKNAQAQQAHVRTNGSVSNARKRDEFELKNNRSPTEVEAFELTFQAKDGSYLRRESSEFIAKAKEEIKKKKQRLDITGTDIDPKVQAEIESEVWKDLMGEDKPGRARCHGIGVTKSQLSPMNTEIRRMVHENERSTNQVQILNSRIAAQDEQLAAQNEQIASQNEQISHMGAILKEFRSEMRILRAACGLFGENEAAAPSILNPRTNDTQVPSTSFGRDVNSQLR